MTFLNMYCTPYHYCLQMTPNVCPPYHLLLTVNFYNLTSTSSPTGVLSGSCSSTSPNAHCCPHHWQFSAVPYLGNYICCDSYLSYLFFLLDILGLDMFSLDILGIILWVSTFLAFLLAYLWNQDNPPMQDQGSKQHQASTKSADL